MHIKAEKAGIIDQPSRTGDNREDILADFLKSHLPKSLSVYKGGKVFNLQGHESKEMDVLITNDISINFLEDMHMFTNVESLASAISVKSSLIKASLYDSLANIASIPQLSDDVLQLYPPANEQLGNFKEHFPSSLVFAYSGTSAITTYRNVLEFYKERRSIPYNRYPSAIIVNGQYTMVFVRNEKVMTNGQKVPANNYYLDILNSDDKGSALAIMLTVICSYISYMPYMTIPIGGYFDSEFGLP